MRTIKKLLSFVLLAVFSLYGFYFPFNRVFASSQFIQASQADFETGNLGTTMDTSFGNLKLKRRGNTTHTETTKSDFEAGIIDNHSELSENNDGEIQVAEKPTAGETLGYYSSELKTDDLALPDNEINSSFLDKENNLLYVSTYSGLSVINTQGTDDPSDDTLLTTYNSSSSPSIAGDEVYSAFLDSEHNLLYVTVNGSVSVVNTQGTVDPSDDTLVTNYDAGTYGYMYQSFLDSEHNLLYLTTSGSGVKVINTQGTVDPSDDNLVTAYNGWPYERWTNDSFLDSANNLLYIDAASGLYVVNTQGTVDPSDDILVTTYNSSSTPAIPQNNTFNSFFDSTHNLLYISTYSGLSVINTQGTIDPSDDTLEITYNSSSTPAILSDSVSSSFLDTENNLLYIVTDSGLSVINTQGTVDPSDDVLTGNYSVDGTSLLSIGYPARAFKDGNFIYVDTDSGLSVINTQGTVDISDDSLQKNYNYYANELVDNNVRSVKKEGDLLYVSSDDGTGLSVINTKGTDSLDDDNLVSRYSSSTSPSIASNSVRDSSLKNNLLYISTDSGLWVIDTQGTTNQSDDTVIARYSTSSDPSIANDYVYSSFLDDENNLLYISTDAGLSVINTHGTSDSSDDTLEISYSQTSSPAIGKDGWGASVFSSYLDNEKNLIYVNTSSGLSVINTQGTVDPSDDTLVINYNYDSNPSIDSMWDNTVSHSFLNNNLLYLSTSSGLSVINTQGTTDSSDDTLEINYNTSSTPAIADDYVKSSFLDEENGLIYISTQQGLSVINTHKTVDPSDDTLEITYDGNSSPAIPNSYSDFAFLDSSKQLYIANQGLSVIKIPTSNSYYLSASYISGVIPASDINMISWDEEKTHGQDISIQTRVGTIDNGDWQDEFNDGDTSNVSHSYPNRNDEYFNDLTEENGVLKMTNVSPPLPRQHARKPQAAYEYVNTWINPNKGASYFPSGSIISAKIRYVGEGATNPSVDLGYDGNMRSFTNVSLNNGEWEYPSFTPSDDFSEVRIATNFQNGTWNNTTDRIEIDWVRVQLPNPVLSWSDWSDPCSDHTGCTIENIEGKTYVQYKVNLSTSDDSSTPEVDSVTLGDGYNQTGEYLSQVFDGISRAHWESLTANQNTPEGTGIIYYTRTGDTPTPDDSWSPWATVNSPISSPDARYLQYKAAFSTSKPNSSPSISQISISYTIQESNNNSNSSEEVNNPANADTIPALATAQRRQRILDANKVNATNTPFLVFRGRVTSLTDAKLVRILRDGRFAGKTKIGNRGKWRKQIRPRKNMVSNFQFQYLDSNNNIITSTPNYAIKSDRRKPIFQTLPRRNTTNGQSVINWQATDNVELSSCNVYFRGKPYLANLDSFVLPTDFPSNPKLKICCKDSAGNERCKYNK